MDLATETLVFSSSSSDVSPAELSSKIPTDTPSYTFYHYPSSTSIIFIYCSSASSKIRERMLYASSRANVVVVARDEGVDVAKRIEIGAPDEIDEDRLKELVGSSSGGAASAAVAAEEAGSGASKQGFARPKRPGKR
jgi:twinfilin